MRIFFAVALVGAALMTTSNVEAGIFGRRNCRVVQTCQVQVRTTHQYVQACQPVRMYQAEPVRTAINNVGRVVGNVLPPYRSCNGNSCTIVQNNTVVYPSPASVTEQTPPTPNVLPAAPVETP